MSQVDSRPREQNCRPGESEAGGQGLAETKLKEAAKMVEGGIEVTLTYMDFIYMKHNDATLIVVRVNQLIGDDKQWEKLLTVPMLITPFLLAKTENRPSGG